MLATKPHVMQLTMPTAPKHATDEVGCFGGGLSGAVTIILGKNHQIYYYFGLNNPFDLSIPTPRVDVTNFGPQGIRKVLLALQQEMPKPVILIKPSSEATYRDMVDILDEMNITNQKRYALVKIAASDLKLLHQAGD